jgi:tetratricopeptide (TPR) repeat protein
LDAKSAAVSFDSLLGLGWAWFDDEAYTDALERFQKAAALKGPASGVIEARLRAGDCLYNLHRYEEAEAEYVRVLERPRAPAELDAAEQWGWCAYRSDRYLDAVTRWKALIARSDAAERAPRLRYWTAWAYFRVKDFEAAQTAFRQVAEKHPNIPWPRKPRSAARIVSSTSSVTPRLCPITRPS